MPDPERPTAGAGTPDVDPRPSGAASDGTPGGGDSGTGDGPGSSGSAEGSGDPASIGRKLPVGPAAAMFLGIGLFVGVMTAIYWFTAYEDAGTTMLLLTAVMAVWFGTFLYLQQRQATATTAEADATTAPPTYLPHASVWPFVMGLGAATLVNGLVLGIWIAVPGLAALALGVGGFIRQSRHRD